MLHIPHVLPAEVFAAADPVTRELTPRGKCEPNVHCHLTVGWRFDPQIPRRSRKVQRFHLIDRIEGFPEPEDGEWSSALMATGQSRPGQIEANGRHIALARDTTDLDLLQQNGRDRSRVPMSFDMHCVDR